MSSVRLKRGIVCLVAVLSVGIVLVPVSGFAQAVAYVLSFDGTPSAPQPYVSNGDLQIFVQGFNARAQQYNVAQHGPNCEPPGFPYNSTNSHVVRSVADTVFQCNGHIMTAPGLSGYAAVYMTPPAVADFSQGPATIAWNMSTLRTSGRDWIDIVLTPWAEHSEMAYNNNDQHIPPHNIHVQLAGTNVLQAYQRIGGGIQYDQGTDILLPGDGGTTWDDVFRQAGTTESPSRQDRFEIRLERNHISVCMPNYQRSSGGVFCWVNTDLREPLDPAVWHDQAAVQFNHRSYNPEKSCIEDVNFDEFGANHSAIGDAQCPPNTWHWDNITVQPFVPYRIIPSAPPQLSVNTSAASTVRFVDRAPAGSYLTFVNFSHTPDLRVSFDSGRNWEAPRLQPAIAPRNGAAEENGEVVWTTIPEGSNAVMVRSSNGYWGTTQLQDFTIFGPPGGQVVPVPTFQPTSVPPTFTPVPTATATPSAVATARVDSTGTPERLPTGTLTLTPTALPSATATPSVEPTQAPTPTQVAAPTVTATPVTCRVLGILVVDENGNLRLATDKDGHACR